MITCNISAGSSSIVQDIIDMCVSLAPIGNWQGFFYKSTTGSQSWCVWAQRMDEDAHELDYVSSSGLASPPDGYDKITVSCPTVTGFALSFTQVNSMPNVIQSGKGGGGSGRGGGGGSAIVIPMSGKTAIADFLSVFNAVSGTATISRIVSKYYYISSSGAKPWAVYAIASVSYSANPSIFGGPVPIVIMTMSGQANPDATSEALTIAAPSTTTLNADGFTQIGVPINLSSY